MRTHVQFTPRFLIGIVAVVTLALIAPTAHAALISVYGDIGINDFNGGPGNPGNPGNAANNTLYDGTGVPTPGGVGSTWNSITDQSLHTGLLTPTGGSTSITFQTTTNGNFQQSGGSPPDPGLMGDDVYAAGVGGTFTFTNLPGSADGYDLYLYSDNGGGYATTFTIGADAETAIDGPNGTGSVSNGGTFVLNQNYVLFTGLQTTGGTISGTFANLREPSGAYAIFNGFQLVELPEPASLSLLATGGLLVLARRRRAA